MPLFYNRLPRMIINDLFSGNNKLYFESLMSRIRDDVEASSLSNKRKVYKAICLSGGQGVGSPSATPSLGFINTVERVDLGDGKERFGLRFRIIEDNYTSDGTPCYTDSVPNPFHPDITEAERQRRISLHPMAFTEVEAQFEQAFTFGSILNVKLVQNTWMIMQVFGAQGFGFGAGAGGAMNAFGPQADTGTWNVYLCNNPVPDYTPDWWVTMLEQVIALGADGPKCSWGKRYDEVCPVDGRGIIGIAHWTQHSLNPLVDEMVSVIGETTVSGWFGRSSASLKAFNSTCNATSNKCFEVGWWKAGYEKFVAHPKTKQIQQTVWKRQFADKSERKLAEYKWAKTKRNLAIISGIWNSAGEGGVNLHSNRGKRTPEETLGDYVMNDHGKGTFSKHRAKRGDAINKNFPCTGRSS